jgi:hypothetical protein
MLSFLALDCGSLQALDATFCGRLSAQALTAALRGRPPLRSLVLSVCSQLDAGDLTALGRLPNLTLLDLSYTEVKVRGAGSFCVSAARVLGLAGGCGVCIRQAQECTCSILFMQWRLTVPLRSAAWDC